MSENTEFVGDKWHSEVLSRAVEVRSYGSGMYGYRLHEMRARNVKVTRAC